jgi:hypothetical protein
MAKYSLVRKCGEAKSADALIADEASPIFVAGFPCKVPEKTKEFFPGFYDAGLFRRETPDFSPGSIH